MQNLLKIKEKNTMDTIIEKIIKVLAEYKDFDAATVKAETSFADLGLDSLDTVDLVMKLEEEYGIAIPMSQDLKTVGDVAKFIADAKK